MDELKKKMGQQGARMVIGNVLGGFFGSKWLD